MTSLLLQQLENNLEIGLKFANLLLVPPGYRDFDEYREKCTSTAFIGTCINDYQRYGVFVHCNTCSNDSQSCLCLECFFSGNHVGHDFFYFQTKDPICDCGQHYSMSASCFCCHHRGAVDSPDISLLTTDQFNKASSVFKIVIDYLNQIYPANESKLILEWLKGFVLFGDGFKRLIINLLVNHLNSLCDRTISAEANVVTSFMSLFFKLLSDDKMKTLYSLAFIKVFPRICNSFKIKSLHKTAAYRSSKALLFLTLRSYSYPKLSNCLLKLDDYIPTIIKYTLSVLKFNLKHSKQTGGWDCQTFLTLFEFTVWRISSIVEHPMNGRDWVFNSPQSRDSFFDMIQYWHFQLPTTRRTEEHVLHEDSSALHLLTSFIMIHELIDKFVAGFKLINREFSLEKIETIQEEISYVGELHDSDIDRLASIVAMIKDKLLTWQLSRQIPEIFNSTFNNHIHALNPLTNEFSISLSLHTLFFNVISTMFYYYKIPYEIIFAKIGISSFLDFIIYPLETYSAALLAQEHVFVRNSEALVQVLANLATGSPQPDFLTSMFGLAQICLATENKFDDFLATVIHSFGLTNWMASFAADESMNVANQVSLLCRFLIILFSNQVSVFFGPYKELVKYRVKHSIWTKSMSALAIKELYEMNFKKYVNIVLNEVSQRYKDQCRAKNDEDLTPFHMIYLNQTFFDAISICLRKHPKQVLPLPPAETKLPVLRIVETNEFFIFIENLCHNLYTLKNPTASHCFISLLYMCIQADCPKFIQKLFDGKDRPSVMKMVSLMECSEYENILELIAQKSSPDLKNEIESLRPHSDNIKSKNRPNKESILAQFQNQMSEFASKNNMNFDNEDINEEDDNNDVICAFCKRKMKFDVDDFGIFAFYLNLTYSETKDIASPIFTYCPHFAHRKCYNAGEDCPLCRAHSTNLFPISGNLKIKIPPQTVFPIADSLFRRIELISRMKTEVSEIDKIVAKSVISILRKNNRADDDPFHCFLANGDIEKYLSTFDSIPKSVVRKVNFILELTNQPKIDDISEIDDLALPFGIEKLPKEFYKLFLKDGVPDPLLRKQSIIGQCLLCGKRCTPIELNFHSSDECPFNFGLYLILNGKKASAVYTMFRGRPAFWGSLYLTEMDSSDVGLTAMEPLFLSMDQVKKLQLELFSGNLMMKTKEVRNLNFAEDGPLDELILQNIGLGNFL